MFIFQGVRLQGSLSQPITAYGFVIGLVIAHLFSIADAFDVVDKPDSPST